MSSHLTRQERDRIAQFHHQGFPQQEIAEKLNRHPSTVCRELKRNGTRDGYFAAQAQEQAVRRRRERPLTRKMDRPQVNEEVRQGLARNWSPQQIAGRMRLDHADDPTRQVGAQTLYDWIEQDDDRDHWKGMMRRRGRRRRNRKNGDPRDGCARIADRCDAIEGRLRIGDWEGDTVLGPPGTGGLVTLVDRKSRYTIITKIRSKHADHVHEKIKQRLKALAQEQRRSLTLDCGKEFAKCHRLEKHLEMELYLADPGCPYQRGTNENTNGLIRQYYPKGTDFRDVSHHEIRGTENLLNGRPRACLGFKTPKEVFLENDTQ
jgi:IS30 family transposase